MSKIINQKIEAEQTAKKLIEDFTTAIIKNDSRAIGLCIDRYTRINIPLICTDTYIVLNDRYFDAMHILTN